MKTISKLLILFICLITVQSIFSQEQKCDSIKNVNISMCDMDNITSAFRERTKYKQLNVINDSIIIAQSVVIVNTTEKLKNDSIMMANYQKNELDLKSIVVDQDFIITKEKKKVKVWKYTSYGFGILAGIFGIVAYIK